MDAMTLVAQGLNASRNILGMTLADFTDADMLVRPVTGANHALWQLGHLIAAENHMLGAVGLKLPALPAGFAEKFDKKTAGQNEAKDFGYTKAQLLALYNQQRDAVVAGVRTLSDATLSAPAPEPMRRMCPTNADLVALGIGHDTMHIGQFQVIRRKLGKPVLF